MRRTRRRRHSCCCCCNGPRCWSAATAGEAAGASIVPFSGGDSGCTVWLAGPLAHSRLGPQSGSHPVKPSGVAGQQQPVLEEAGQGRPCHEAAWHYQQHAEQTRLPQPASQLAIRMAQARPLSSLETLRHHSRSKLSCGPRQRSTMLPWLIRVTTSTGAPASSVWGGGWGIYRWGQDEQASRRSSKAR